MELMNEDQLRPLTCREYATKKLHNLSEIHADIHQEPLRDSLMEQGTRTVVSFPDWAVYPSVAAPDPDELTFYWVAGVNKEGRRNSLEISLYETGYWVRFQLQKELVELTDENWESLPLASIYEFLVKLTSYVEGRNPNWVELFEREADAV